MSSQQNLVVAGSLLAAVITLSTLVPAPAQDQDQRPATQQDSRPGAGAAPVSTGAGGLDWRTLERPVLRNHVQLTFAEQFVKAGESYFSPDDSMIIFQAIETPEDDGAAEPFYAMFIADVLYDDDRITGIENVRRISPEGSANTCGWFHPTEPGVIIFASTIGEPTESTPPGYQRDTGRYRWMFPPEMTIVRTHVDRADGTPESLEVLIDRDAYVAECALSPCGRYLVYCSLESNEGDLFVRDIETGRTTRVVEARGYDGGPFFSPDGKRITYRSDRRGNSLLQLFVGELAFNDRGEVVGLKAEHQLTDNEHVNWAPFWHPGGRHLVYATSEMGHTNYEVYIIDADPGNLEGSTGSIRYGTRKRRITFADRADVLPAFNSDGSIMMWTAQRGEDGESQVWVADFVLDIDAGPIPRGYGGR